MNLELAALLVLGFGGKEFKEVPHLAERKRLTRGQLEFRLKVEAPPARGGNRDWHYFVWYDADQYRWDRKPFGMEGPKEIYGQNCHGPGFDVHYDPSKPARNMLPLIVQIVVPGKGRPGWDLRIDPQLFGMGALSFGVYRERALSDLPGAEAREVLERKELKGMEIVKYRLKHGAIIEEVTIRKGKTPFLKSCSVQADYAMDYRVRRAMEAEPGEFGKVVFPKKIITTYENNGVLEEKVVIDVLDANFDREIPPKVFTLAGMGIPPGTRVDYYFPGTIGYPHIWDGKDIVRDRETPKKR